MYKSFKYARKQVYIFFKMDCMITYLLHFFFQICNFLTCTFYFRKGGGSFNFIHVGCFQHDLFINLFKIYLFVYIIYLFTSLNQLFIYLFITILSFISFSLIRLFIYCSFIHSLVCSFQFLLLKI